MIRKRHAPQLHVVFRRNADFRADIEAVLSLAIFGARPGKSNFVVFGRAQGGLISYRPEFSGRCIAQINKCAPAIARGILAPAGDCQIAPTAVTAPGIADRHVVTAVGEEVDLRDSRSGTVEDSHPCTLAQSAFTIHSISKVCDPEGVAPNEWK